MIRALYDYEAQSGQELSFSRGDFFHVIGRENDSEWYEACNPGIPSARGLVPVQFFQALGRTERDSGSSLPDTSRSTGSNGGIPFKSPDHDSGYGDAPSGPMSLDSVSPGLSQRASRSGSGKGTGAMVFGQVMYDFQAERADELEAKAGEAIIVIAQSNPEWFVAKPIARLGGPGLIPVSFVEIRDMASNQAVNDPQEAVKRAGIPRVEEWKKMAADYKNSSITLGKFDAQAMNGGGQPSGEQRMDRLSLQQGPSPGAGYGQQRNTMQQGQNGTQSQHPAPVEASIPRYCFAEGKYWFVIEARLDNGKWYELSRYYEDFYDFQIALLTEFPDEAGNTPNGKRTLPYMPGPVNYVTDLITEGRLRNLDAYVKDLLAQPPHISQCDLVRQFFAPRDGDAPVDKLGYDSRNSVGSQPQPGSSPPDARLYASPTSNGNGEMYSNGFGNNKYANGGGSQPYYQQQQPGAMGMNGQQYQQPQMTRQASSLSQRSHSSATLANQPMQKIKVKVRLPDGDLVWVKVEPHLGALYEAIQARRGKDPIPQSRFILSYETKDDIQSEGGMARKYALDTHADLEAMLNQPKVVVCVQDM